MKIPTEAQIRAARANGARSRGPATPEGKRRSSRNSVRHGLLAKCAVLSNESPEAFRSLLRQHLARFAPADGVEFGLIEEMVAAYWRMRRAWAIENHMMEAVLALQNPDDAEGDRLSAAFRSLAADSPLSTLHRYEAMLHRSYRRAMSNLLVLQTFTAPENAAPPPGNPAKFAPTERTQEPVENKRQPPCAEPGHLLD